MYASLDKIAVIVKLTLKTTKTYSFLKKYENLKPKT